MCYPIPIVIGDMPRTLFWPAGIAWNITGRAKQGVLAEFMKVFMRVHVFLIFTNDLPSYLNTKVVMDADDVQFLHLASPQSVLELQSDVECTLDIASHWFIQNCLKINPTKTDLLVLKS